MQEITINLSDEIFSIIKKRARKAIISQKKLVEDIVRRSMVSYKDTRSSIPRTKSDDTLVNIFSRERKGRKSKNK